MLKDFINSTNILIGTLLSVQKILTHAKMKRWCDSNARDVIHISLHAIYLNLSTGFEGRVAAHCRSI
jgi:hypothetical protein